MPLQACTAFLITLQKFKAKHGIVTLCRRRKSSEYHVCLYIVLVPLPPPSNSLHGLVLILARPQHITHVHRAYAKSSSKQPHDHQQNRQRARYAVHSLALQNLGSLYGGQGKPSVGEDEGPPVERKGHVAYAGQDGDGSDEEEPVGEEDNEEACHDAEDAHDLSVRNGDVGPVVFCYERWRSFGKRDEPRGSVACKYKSDLSPCTCWNCTRVLLTCGPDGHKHAWSNTRRWQTARHQSLHVYAVHEERDNPCESLKQDPSDEDPPACIFRLPRKYSAC